jgi:hypothetical protein
MEPSRLPRPTRLLLEAAMLVLAAAATPAAARPGRMTGPSASRPIAPHRDGNIAVAEELEAARCAGTVAAYDLFLARHPDHPLARTARRERRLIAAGHRPNAP